MVYETQLRMSILDIDGEVFENIEVVVDDELNGQK